MEDRQIARLWEVDLLRGIAIVLMVLYHFVFDLDYFEIYEMDPTSGFPLVVARTTVTLFLLLVGLSLTLSHSRARMLGQEGRFPLRLLRKSAGIMILALGISVVTYLFVGSCFIVFGVLHMIGLSLLLAYPFLRIKRANFIIGLLFISAGIIIQTVRVDSLWLLWLGLAPQDFCSLDYVPLLPWFGVVLIGMGLGGVLYPDYSRRVKLPDLSGNLLVRTLTTLGQNSLAIYLIHQPIMLGILYCTMIAQSLIF